MHLDDYQIAIGDTDFIRDRVGNNSSEYLERLVVAAKALREAYRLKESGLPESESTQLLGNVLWYVGAAATALNVPLEVVAAQNLEQTRIRLGKKSRELLPFDSEFPKLQRLPQTLTIRVNQRFVGETEHAVPVVTIVSDLVGDEPLQLGNEINDNAFDADGYRFHDVLHLAYATFLDWSPVVRAMLHRKRKHDPQVDEYEDGARARDIEEALTALIFKHAKRPGINFFANSAHVPINLLEAAELLTDGLEVKSRTHAHWERAILEGYRVFRAVKENSGGTIRMDRKARTLRYYAPKKGEMTKMQEVKRGTRFKH